jgi:uncharacterized membrane protein YqaE (UPF0057 family)
MVGLHNLPPHPGDPFATAGCAFLQLFLWPIIDTYLAAVAARFGIGQDFFINLILTLCGYIPGRFISTIALNLHSLTPDQGHVHNFYIQVPFEHLGKDAPF